MGLLFMRVCSHNVQKVSDLCVARDTIAYDCGPFLIGHYEKKLRHCQWPTASSTSLC